MRQVGPDRAHHRVVEGDQRLGDLVGRVVGAERVRLPADQTAAHQDVERMGQVAGLPTDVAADAAPGGVAVGDGGQDRMVKPHVMQFGLGGEQVARLPEQRACRVQHRPLDPPIEVVRIGGHVIPSELTPVGRRAADDRVHLDGEHRVRDVPELRRQLVIKRRDEELKPGPSAQWRVPGQQRAHEGHGRAAQQQPAAAALALGPARRERVLEDRRQRRVRPDQIGKLVDHHGDRMIVPQGQQRVKHLTPAVETQCRRQPEVRPQRRPYLVQGLAVGRFIGREVEASGRLAQGPQQEGLALAAPAGDDPEGRAWPLVSCEGGELHPLDVTVEHVVWLARKSHQAKFS